MTSRRLLNTARLLAALTLLIGFAASLQTSAAGAASDSAAPAAASASTVPPPSAKPCEVRSGEGDYPNPLNECAAADPGMVIQGNTWYAFTTGLNLYRSTDAGHHWDSLGKFVTTPSGYVDMWAPEVYHIGGQWVAYFSMRTAPGQFEKVYVATSRSIDRGWTLNPTPIYGTANHSTIDATMFNDPKGGLYLLWKDDYQNREQRRISIARLSGNGKRVVSAPTPIMSVTQTWESNSIEAPTMLVRDGTYYLFYSGSLFTYTGGYAVGVARATSPTANFDAGKHDGPILTGDDHFASPGHQFITNVDLPGRGQTQVMFYHAYPWYDAAGNKLTTPQTRKLMMDELQWGTDGWPTVNNGHPSR